MELYPVPIMELYPVPWHSSPVNIPGVPVRLYAHEQAFQVYCATWLRKQWELTKDPRYANWHHSANERQGARAGFNAKMMGQAKGFPDFINCQFKCVLELKVNAKVSPDQESWLLHFKQIGWTSEVIRTFGQFKCIVLALKLN